MPKSKVRKKKDYTPPPAGRTPVRVAGPTHPVYIGVMIAMWVIGLAWLVVSYLAGPGSSGAQVPFMVPLGNWNFLIGFSLIVIGLLMTMRWR